MITTTEIEKLSVMYEGDKARDASSKIRGFLFQDYVAIMCLLQENVECVCLEYIEDVDVFYKDGTFEFIQVKYQPASEPQMKEITTDLYYQFVRLKMLHSDMKLKPRLYVHHNSLVARPTQDKMKSYLGLGNQLKDEVTYGSAAEEELWLREHVYKKSKKDEQKASLFKNKASKTSIEEFLKDEQEVSLFENKASKSSIEESSKDESFKIEDLCDIKQYRDSLMEKLVTKFPKSGTISDGTKWKSILLGLAISYIQRRYFEGAESFEAFKVSQSEFSDFITNSTSACDERIISNYLIGVASVAYERIVEKVRLSDRQSKYLYRIFQNTVRWLDELTKTVDGQYKIINALSREEKEDVKVYKDLSVGERIIKVAEMRYAFVSFLNYLWKIMMNICMVKIVDEAEDENNISLFDPCTYIEFEIEEYICFNFPDDKLVERSVFLPSIADGDQGTTRNIAERMIDAKNQPQKWFYKNGKLKPGRNYYIYSTAKVVEKPTVVDIDEDPVYIECMDCIGIEEDNWANPVNCDECIFLDRCFREEN